MNAFRPRRPWFVGILGVVALWGAGCSGGGPARFQLSGTVTFHGRPVPAGQIRFVPDQARDNSGPGGSAEIKNGTYVTLAHQGTVGGPHLAVISGFDGVPVPIPNSPGRSNPNGSPLFAEITVAVDVPRSDGTLDFDLPVKK